MGSKGRLGVRVLAASEAKVRANEDLLIHGEIITSINTWDDGRLVSMIS